MVKWLKYIVLAANIVIFAVLAFTLPLTFEENDDVMMAMIANGSYSGTPDCHLVYINVIYGWVLMLLYSMTRAIEWYTLSFAVLHILSMSVLSYCILTTPNRATWEKVLWLLILYVLWARIIVALQFTTTAGLTALAGCVLLLRESKKARWTGVLFVIVAALIRFMAAGLVGVLMAPIIIYTYRLEWRKYIAIVVMLTAVVACRYTNGKIYDSDPEWKYYREYNKLRAQVNDDPNAKMLEPENLPEGIEWSDYEALLRFYPDPERIDLTAIRQLRAVVDNVSLREQIMNVHLLDQYVVELCIILALLLMMIFTTGNRSKFTFLILYAVFMAVLMIYVSLDGILKNRVFLCMLWPFLMTDFMLLPKTTDLKRKWGIVIALLVLCGWYGDQTNRDRIVNAHYRKVWTILQQPILNYVPNDAYVITCGTGMLIQASNPWHIWPYECRKYTLGWATWIPFNKALGHSYRAFLNEKVYLFTLNSYEEEDSRVQNVRRQLQHNYGITTDLTWKVHNGRFALIQMRAKE